MTCHILSNSILFISCCEWCNEDQHSCSENIVFCALQAGRSWNGGRWNSWVSYWNSQSPHDSIDQWHCIQMCEHTSLNRWFHHSFDRSCWSRASSMASYVTSSSLLGKFTWKCGVKFDDLFLDVMTSLDDWLEIVILLHGYNIMHHVFFFNMFSVITYFETYISTHLCFDVFDCAEQVQEDTLILTLSFLSLDAFQLNMSWWGEKHQVAFLQHLGSMLTAPAFEKYVSKWLHIVLADIFIYRVHSLPQRTLEFHHLLMLKHVIPKVSAASLRVAPCTSSISRRCVDWFLWVERRTSIDPCVPKSRWWFQSSFFLASLAYFPEAKCKFQGGYIFAIGGFKFQTLFIWPIFSPTWGKWSKNWTNIFQMGRNHQLEMI